MMRMTFLRLFALVLIWVGPLGSSTRHWELKTVSGESYAPERHAISLNDHNSGGLSTPNGLVRDLCEQCLTCVWKQRQGFTTESEWQAAVSHELARLERQKELVGSWVVEAPSSMILTTAILEELGSTVGVSLNHLVVSERGARRFFVVSATFSHIDGLLKAGFNSVTPIPPRLKVDPILEEAAANAAAATTAAAAAAGSPSTNTSSRLSPSPPTPAVKAEAEAEETTGAGLLGIYAEISLPPAPRIYPNSSRSYGSSSNTDAVLPSLTSTPPPLLLATSWTGMVARRVGHSNAQVEAEGANVVTIRGLLDSTESYAVALDLVMHGGVEWVSHTSHDEPSNYYAAQAVQQWPFAATATSKQRKWVRRRGGGGLLMYGEGGGGGVGRGEEGGGEGFRDHGLLSTPSSTGGGGLEFNVTASFRRNGIKPTKNKNKKKSRTVLPPLHALGILGQNVVVGVADIGLDYDSCFFADTKETPTFQWGAAERHAERQRGKLDIWESTTHRKLRQYIALSTHGVDDNTKNLIRGHGTKVAGTIAGSLQSDTITEKPGDVAKYRGVAPEAKLAFYDISKSSLEAAVAGPALLSPVDVTEMFSHAYRVGARIYSMSFGKVPTERYGKRARSLDAYCFRNQDFVVFAAAGNEGMLAKTINCPATSKSVVAVGSHLNLSGKKGTTKKKSGGAGGAGAIDYMSDFSSRGPTMDGRIKPDVCGPGEALKTPTIGGKPGECPLTEYAGTSAAAPVVAGVTALIRQYFTDGYYPRGEKVAKNGFEPMGALLKAVLVNSGRPLSMKMAAERGGKKKTEVQTPSLPNFNEGWGGVDLSTTLITPSSPPGLVLKVYGTWSQDCAACPVVHDKETWKLSFKTNKTNPNNIPLKVTLVWFDKEASLSAQSLTIHNLDLSLDSGAHPHTNRYYPNGLSEADPLNPVEHIAIPTPSLDHDYTVNVEGTSIPLQAQWFALVISGPLDESTFGEARRLPNQKQKSNSRLPIKDDNEENRKERGGGPPRRHRIPKYKSYRHLPVYDYDDDDKESSGSSA